MMNTDMVAFIANLLRPRVVDLYSKSNSQPPVDFQDDYIFNISIGSTSDWVNFVAARYFNTNDSDDFRIPIVSIFWFEIKE